MYDYEEISNSFDECEDIVYCRECNKVIGRSTNGACFDYYGNAICNECAVSNSAGEICPECGRKVPHEYMMSEFCVDCTNEE